MDGDLPSHLREPLEPPIPTTNLDESIETFIRNRERVLLGLGNRSFNFEFGRWLSGDNNTIPSIHLNHPVHAGHNFRPPEEQQNPPARSGGSLHSWSSNSAAAFIAATILPFIQMHNRLRWVSPRFLVFNPCFISSLLRLGELTFIRLALICTRIREKIVNFTNSYLISDVFASTMDLILILYAFGFLFLSLCQTARVQS